jgi:serine/threonine protein kinase/Flp pilus assembly protein TadD
MDAEEILQAAVEKESPAERAAYLESVCGQDTALRALVEGLLRAHDEAGSFLEQPLFGPGETVDQPARPEGPGTAVGPYKLLEQIGEGGFGVVFLAEQQEPIRRKVALKVLKPGMDSRQVLARFEVERQALALMDHPNIATVLGGGDTASGRPYFVMELVKGVPLTGYCDDNRLTPRKRLELFLQVCAAVQHAHQKGVIHRDLKPSNVLVALHDSAPVAKVIDFGVAKALGQELTDRTLHTGLFQMLGTPLYMSPEQAGQSGLDIDTRSDLYSLGVLLYELLTGTTPFDKELLQAVGYDEVRRIIREEEPPRPSTRLSTLGPASATVSANRRSDPRRLSRMFRGDLDWVVMKCLEKDRNRRYESASALAADVRRYLADEPVQARPASAWYRGRKFVLRHRAALIPAALLLTVLVLGVAAAAWSQHERSARRAETERAVTAALTQAETHLDQGDKQTEQPERWQASVHLAQLAVERAEELVTTGGGGDELAERVARVRAALDAAAKDSGLLVEVDRIRLEQATVKADHYDLRRVAPRYATMFRDYGLDPAAPAEAAARVHASRVRRTLLAALEDWRRVTTDAADQRQLEAVLQAIEPEPGAFRARWRAAARRRDGATLARLARESEAQGLPAADLVNLARDLEREKEWAAAERLLRTGQERFPGDFWLNHNLGMALQSQGPVRAEEAARYLTAALALRNTSPGVFLNLGVILTDKRDVEGAIRCYQAALRLDPKYALARAQLGYALQSRGDLEGAVRECRRALDLDPKLAITHSNLGHALQAKGDLEGAVRECRRALDLDPEYASAHNNLGNALKAKRDLEGAISAYRRALDLEPNLANAHFNLGNALKAKGDVEGAVGAYRRALSLDPRLASAHCNLGTALETRGDVEGAIGAYRRALDLDPENVDAHYNLGLALKAKGDLEGAIRAYRAALRIDPEDADAHYNLAIALRAQGDVEGAIHTYRAALRINPRLAQAHCNLGLLLKQQGQFAEALRALKTGHGLGSRRADWRYPSAAWVRDAERLAALDGKLAKVLKGEAQPADAAEWAAMAWLCERPSRQLHVAAVRFYAEAFASDPKLADDLEVSHRYDAACAAALAGCALGKDDPPPDAAARAELRRQALDWLRADLAANARLLAGTDPKAPARVRQRLRHWQQDADFQGVRGEGALARLPEAERQPWRDVWDDVAATLGRAQGRIAPEKKSDRN